MCVNIIHSKFLEGTWNMGIVHYIHGNHFLTTKNNIAAEAMQTALLLFTLTVITNFTSRHVKFPITKANEYVASFDKYQHGNRHTTN